MRPRRIRRGRDLCGRPFRPPFLTPAERGRGQRSAANPTARVQTPISESGLIPIFEAGRNGVPQLGAEEIPPGVSEGGDRRVAHGIRDPPKIDRIECLPEL